MRSFIPPPLPPSPPPDLTDLQSLLEQARQALGRLDGLASMLPDISLFVYTYVRKEAEDTAARTTTGGPDALLS